MKTVNVGDFIIIRRGRLRGSAGTVVSVTTGTSGDDPGAVGYREHGTGRLRYLSRDRLGDIEVTLEGGAT